jgi:ABC-type multidrug transport system fused ATPase/permease subunit
MAFSLLYLIFTYTNGLAVYFLAIFVLIYIAIKTDISKKQKILIGFIIIVTLASFFMSLTFRNDIHIVATRDQANNDINFLTSTKERLFFTFEHFLVDIHLLPNVSSIFNGVFLFVIFGSLCFVFGWEMSVFSFWIICTIIASIISKGTSYYGPELAIQRASVIFPVFFLMLIKIIKSIKIEFKRLHYLMFILFIFTFITGICYQENFLFRRESEDYYRRRQYNLIKWIKVNLSDKDLFYYRVSEKTAGELTYVLKDKILPLLNKEFTEDILREELKKFNLNSREIDKVLKYSRYNRRLMFYFDVNLNYQYISMKDLTQYFFPDFSHTILNNECTELKSKENTKKFLFITKGQVIRKDYNDIRTHLEYINTFRFRDDEPVDLYRIK